MLNHEPEENAPEVKELTLRIGRREFTRQGVLALLAGVTITVSECGGSSPSGPSTTPPPSNGNISGTVSANHGHIAVITAAQITAMNAVDLDITGTATHPHTVSLTANEVAQAAARTRVEKLSTTNDGHNHTVTFN
jgi:hypothetical protein